MNLKISVAKKTENIIIRILLSSLCQCWFAFFFFAPCKHTKKNKTSKGKTVDVYQLPHFCYLLHHGPLYSYIVSRFNLI